jgi:hypothetical protein
VASVRGGVARLWQRRGEHGLRRRGEHALQRPCPALTQLGIRCRPGPVARPFTAAVVANHPITGQLINRSHEKTVDRRCQPRHERLARSLGTPATTVSNSHVILCSGGPIQMEPGDRSSGSLWRRTSLARASFLLLGWPLSCAHSPLARARDPLAGTAKVVPTTGRLPAADSATGARQPLPRPCRDWPAHRPARCQDPRRAL